MAARILPFPRRDAWHPLIRVDPVYACGVQALDGLAPPEGTPPLDPLPAKKTTA
jgi:hypothetical protein